MSLSNQNVLRKRKTFLNISIPNVFRDHEINVSYLWPMLLEEVLKVFRHLYVQQTTARVLFVT